VNSTGKFNSIIVKTLKPVFYFSRRGAPEIKEKNKSDKTVIQYGSFEPTLDPSYILLDNT
jgi:hypothetical protein